MKTDVLTLAKGDELNYHAVANYLAGRRVRRSASRRLIDSVSPARKQKLLHRQNYCCDHCKKPFKYQNGHYHDVTADHVIQYCYGGEANHHNIVLVHYACNLDRANNYSIKIIEDHFGPIDRSMVEYVPVVYFKDRRNKVSALPIGNKL